MRPLIFLMATSALYALAGCSAHDDGAGVGGVTASEARALNNAAEMLDSRSPPPAGEPGK
ncbi:MAG: hypothetical protein ABI395_07985 [Sphingobium sp.]